MTNTDNQNSTYNSSSSGPRFGNGYDIYISDKCNVNVSSNSNFPTSFNCLGQYSKGQASYTAFSGAVNGSSYKVV